MPLKFGETAESAVEKDIELPEAKSVNFDPGKLAGQTTAKLTLVANLYPAGQYSC